MAINTLVPSPAGELSHTNIRTKINELITLVNLGSTGGGITLKDTLDNPGDMRFSAVNHTIEVRGDIGNTLQIGQEEYILVVNKTGSTINEGALCRIIGHSSADFAFTIDLAIANMISTSDVDGIATTTMLADEVGLITAFGKVNDLNTLGFNEGEIIYLSDTTPGLFTSARPHIPLEVGHIGAVNATSGSLLVNIRKLAPSIHGTYTHLSDQVFSTNVTSDIVFSTNEISDGITHAEGSAEFEFPNAGEYQFTIEPQYTRTTGGGIDVLNIFYAVDTGSGFVAVADSNIKLSVNTAGATNVSPLTGTIDMAVGHKLKFRAQVSDSNLILDFTAASGIAPNDLPATPSVILNIIRISD